LTRIETQRVQAAGFLLPEQQVRDRKITDARIRGRSPFEAAERAAFADAALPDERALLVGIERPHHAGLLADHDNALAAGQVAQDRRIAEVEVGAVVTDRTVLALRVAADHVDVLRRDLAGPIDLAALEIDRNNRVAVRPAGPRVLVPGRDIKLAAPQIDRRRRPDRNARRFVELRAKLVLARRLGLIDHEGLPDLLA